MGHVTRMGKNRNAHMVWSGNLGKRFRLEDPGVSGRMALKWVYGSVMGGGFIRLRTGTGTNGGLL